MNDNALGINDFLELILRINTVFDLMCFSSTYSVNFPEYSQNVIPPDDQQRTSDIENILDWIIKESNLFKMPENEPKYWLQHKQENLTDEDIRFINDYRVKFGMNKI